MFLSIPTVDPSQILPMDLQVFVLVVFQDEKPFNSYSRNFGEISPEILPESFPIFLVKWALSFCYFWISPVVLIFRLVITS